MAQKVLSCVDLHISPPATLSLVLESPTVESYTSGAGGRFLLRLEQHGSAPADFDSLGHLEEHLASSGDSLRNLVVENMNILPLLIGLHTPARVVADLCSHRELYANQAPKYVHEPKVTDGGVVFWCILHGRYTSGFLDFANMTLTMNEAGEDALAGDAFESQ